ncbi:TonB family protein [Fodinibius sediminis]|uniref:TonB family C-terminal domain-containing protein n=1 Tax=Fodinibius sediminis TaxID=1214077 RepID=A0A521DMG6_9BACT|nr:TonB family protein [Fodinibius sediminis]SMO72792.1 TonB family C-terminal domain-containing protein [Fodinibius sediminis]
MYALTDFLQWMGTALLQPFWFPVVIWTIVAIPVILFLRRKDSWQPVYQYHSRVALLLALPLGIIGSYGVEALGQLLVSSEGATAKLIVIQNPIVVSAAPATPTFWQTLSSPMLWIGFFSTLFILGALYHLCKLGVNAIQLKQIGQQLSFSRLKQMDEPYIPSGDKKFQHINPLIAFSAQASVPFTYGWLKTRIVIPAELKTDPEKTAMAVRHELMHIKHRDFLLNGVLMVVKALFWFHPLSHYLYRSSQEYREITCDGQVLADTQFSRKRYANLLFELAEREYQNSNLAMSMAVNPSSLKKRIQVMSTQNISTATFRSSFLLTLATATLVVLTISCSDLSSDDGITNTEFQEAQSQLNLQADKDQPLYIINGEIISENEVDAPNALSRLKSEYISSVNILKGQDATDAYGNSGQNGVVKIQLHEGIDVQTVLSDLKPASASKVNPNSKAQEDFFVAVEQMPRLIGGLGELQTKINYPEEAREAGDQGRVIIRFIVNEEGEVENPEIIRGVSESLDQEALRVVKQAKFKPGRQRGQPVRVQYSLPMIFRLAGSGDGSDEQSASSASDENEKRVNSLDEVAVVGYTQLESPEVETSQMTLQDVKASKIGTLTGKVISTKDNTPLAGANVVIAGTSKGSSTDQNGKFSIPGLNQGTHSLTVSYVGYQPSEGTVTIE